MKSFLKGIGFLFGVLLIMFLFYLGVIFWIVGYNEWAVASFCTLLALLVFMWTAGIE